MAVMGTTVALLFHPLLGLTPPPVPELIVR
jgi:hypothetical protein